jgi:hypothetical protein
MSTRRQMSMRASNPGVIASAVCAAMVLTLACGKNGASSRADGGGGAGGAGAGQGGGAGSFDAGAAAGHPDANDAAAAGQDGAAGQPDAPDAGQDGDASAGQDAYIPEGDANATYGYAETPEAFRNPMKGFRPTRYIGDPAFKDHEYASTYKQYIPYSALESSATDTVQKIKDWSDANWGTLRARNLKVIPRVVIVYPGTGEYWGDLPHDGTPSQWTSPALQARLVKFVEKLGQAWANDPRVAAVEMGLWGKWGEHNIYPDTVEGSDRIPPSFQTALGDAFNYWASVKKVMIRYPSTFTAYRGRFGVYWDSFALPDDDVSARGIVSINAMPHSPVQMISGEVAYDWGDQSMLGGSPNGTLGSNANTDYVISQIRRVYASSLGWIAEYTPDGGTISANAARMQKELGYRFVIGTATFTARMAPGGPLTVELTVNNVGHAPFFYNWPVEVSLLDDSRKPVWRANFDTDISQWNFVTPTTVVRGTFTPTGVPNGEYTLAVAVLDPASNAPSLRFANFNYYRGGRTALGRVAIGGPFPLQNLGTFDSLKSDNTLSY